MTDNEDERTLALMTLSDVRSRAPRAPRESDKPHDFESEHGAVEGGTGPCAVCGQPRGNWVHAPLPAFSKLMNEVLS